MTTSTNETDSIANTGDDAAFTNAQLAQMFNQGMNGDTSATTKVETTEETDAKPGALTDAANSEKTPEIDGKQATAAPTAQPEAKPNADAATEPENSVIVAKDGVHKIPFSTLQEARDGERQWREKAQEAQQKLDDLLTQAQARAEAGQTPTKTDNMAARAEAAIEAGADAGLFGDFSEEALSAGIQKLVTQQVQAQVQQRVAQALEPFAAQQQEDAASAHVGAILKAHPEAPSILESSEFADWQGKQPTYVQAAMKDVLDKGSSQQVIELLGSYKAAMQPAQPTQQSPEKAQPQATQAAAQKVVEQLKTPVPNSPSDIPGGTSGGGTLAERLSAMSEVELFNAVNSGEISEDQLNRYLSRKS